MNVDWSEVVVSLGPAQPVAAPEPNVPIFPWFPDGHIAMLPLDKQHVMYWASSSSYRAVGPGVAGMKLDPPTPVLEAGPAGSFDNGGAWLYSVFCITERQWLGFYHAEDHAWPGFENPDKIAWKSVALCGSNDAGRTWQKLGPILTSADAKPAQPTWGGVGDFCVVRDAARNRWVCVYSDRKLCLAVSDDPHAAPGTWCKYFGGEFKEPGLGGRQTPLPDLRSRPGANPSVHFNTSLNQWFMIWHTWTGNLVYALSNDLIHWTQPVTLLKTPLGQKAWYPTVVGESDVLAGEDAQLFYALWPNTRDWRRQFVQRTIHFGRKPANAASQPSGL